VCVGVAYFRVADAAKSVVAIENADGAINQTAPTTHEPRHGPPGRRRAGEAREDLRERPCPPSRSGMPPTSCCPPLSLQLRNLQSPVEIGR
jgi:hypothetical protein